MVVNINPCASIYDETLQALKFSAIATQVRKQSFDRFRFGFMSEKLNVLACFSSSMARPPRPGWLTSCHCSASPQEVATTAR